jgi:hypothetical protein
MIPLYESNGNLPPGIYKASWQELVDRFGFNEHRKYLLGSGELFPNIKEATSALHFLDFFQQDKENKSKGIIEIDLDTLL